jgi:hypothetical protein
MLFYALSEQRIRGVLRLPDRKEKGIAEHTIAVMRRVKTKKKPEEIWVMYQTKSQKSKIKSQKLSFKTKKNIMISAWRYPGVTKPGAPIPIPRDILEELGG